MGTNGNIQVIMDPDGDDIANSVAVLPTFDIGHPDEIHRGSLGIGLFCKRQQSSRKAILFSGNTERSRRTCSA